MKKRSQYIVTTVTIAISLVSNFIYAQDDIPPPPNYDPGDPALPIDQWIPFGMFMAIVLAFLWQYYQITKKTKKV